MTIILTFSMCIASIILQSAMVRSYAPYDRKKQGSSASKKQRAERYSTEWDVRIDCDPAYADKIQENLYKSKDMMDFCMVSGIEQADTVLNKRLNGQDAGSWGSNEDHVHIGLIFKYALRRDQVLSVIRGLSKKGDEYCVPRNKKFSYAGWYIHHAKMDQKLVLEPAMRLEFGVLPLDDDTEYNRTSIIRLYKKFGCSDAVQKDLLKIKFAQFLSEE